MKALIEYPFEQRSPEWYETKLGIPSGTSFDSIITPAKGEYASEKARKTLIARLIDELVRPDDQQGFEGNKHTERGNELEPQARAWYERFYATKPCRQVGFIFNPDLGAGISPDLLVGEDGGAEIKCPDGKTHVLYLMNGVVPDEYKAQVHGSIVVSRRKWWDFVSYCEGYPPLVVRTVRNEYTGALESYLVRFNAELEVWKEKIIRKED